MDYKISADTDIGIKKATNQDCLIVRKAKYASKNIVFAVLCDGMGGLSEGEVASRKMLEEMTFWFDNTYPINLKDGYTEAELKNQWLNLVAKENLLLKEYGNSKNIKLGTTLTAMLIEDDIYYILHLGDCRIYEITKEYIKQLTADHTVIAREIFFGRLTKEQAKIDPRRNVLLQCIGASDEVKPDFFCGNVESDSCYIICSDGFRHMVSEKEIYETFSKLQNCSEEDMKGNIRKLIDLNKNRKETDNISAIAIRSWE